MRAIVASSLILLPSLSAESLYAESGPLGWGRSGIAQEMETDRPDFTEGTQTIQSGHLQFEFGYTYTKDSAGGEDLDQHVLPELLARFGLLDDLELRLDWEGYTAADLEGRDVDGVSDMGVGFKHRMYRADGPMPDLSFIAALSLPTGSSDYTAGEVEPEFKLLWAYELQRCGIAGNLNFAAPAGEEERYFEVSASMTVGTDLSDQIGSYLEYFGFYPTEAVVEDDEHYINGGFTWALTPNVQLDLRAGFGINGGADDFFAGSGLSLRI